MKNKNIRELLGKPLIAYSILQAKESGLFDYVVVNSDSDKILEIAKKWGADFVIRRPAELATDRAPKLPAIQQCIIEAEKITGCTFDTIVDLDATSPLRNNSDIHNVVNLLEEKQVFNVITGAPARRSPYFNLVEVDDHGVARLSKRLPNEIVRRQDSPQCYDMNASIDAWRREGFFTNTTIFNEDTLLYVMPEERSIDIDSELDFEFVSFLMKRKEIGEKE